MSMTDTRRILLVKHAESLLTPEVTAERWRLSDAGRAACGPLAERLRAFAPTLLVSSSEPKAMETAQLVAHALAIPSETGLDLHEHDRSNVRLVPRGAFEQYMAEFFAQPHDLIYGRETADEVHTRFRGAVERACREHPDQRPAIVTHGTVIALLVARANKLDALSFWKRLTMPAIVVVRLPLFALDEVITDIA